MIAEGAATYKGRSKELSNIIFKGRHIGVIPQVETLIPIVLDDLTRKYQKGRWLRYEGKPAEWKAIAFVRKKKGWSDANPKWLPLVRTNE